MFICEDERASLFLSHHHTWTCFLHPPCGADAAHKALEGQAACRPCSSHGWSARRKRPKTILPYFTAGYPREPWKPERASRGLMQADILPHSLSFFLLHRVRVRVGAHPFIVGFVCSGAEQLWDEVVEGIRHYFNKSLGCLLLYGPERYVYT